MRVIIVWLLPLLALPGVAISGETDLLQRCTPALRDALLAAQRDGQARLLVVARIGEAGRSDAGAAAAMETLTAHARKILAESGLREVVSDRATAVACEQNSGGLLQPGHVETLQKLADFDAVLTLDYEPPRDRALLRVAVVDSGRVRFVRIVRLGEGIVAHTPAGPGQQPRGQAARAEHESAAKASGRGGSRSPSVAGPVQPPPGMEGCSGFRIARQPQPTRGKVGSAFGETTGGASGGETGEETPAVGERPRGDISDVNRAIVQFALDHLGEQVGNGECWTLAAQALKAAGAQPPQKFDFGEEIGLDALQPGDILQFTSAYFELPGAYIYLGTPDHTAIVHQAGGNQTVLLHQNFGRKTVSMLSLNLSTMTRGTVQAYRAIPAE